MPRHLQKSLRNYLLKIKRETGKLHLPSNSFSSSKKWVLSGCKHPKTLSFSINRKHRKRSSKSKSKYSQDEDDDEIDLDSGHAATLSDIDRFLEENFKSLCIRDDDDYDDDDYDERDPKQKKKLEESDDDDDSDDDSDRFKRAWGPPMYDSPKTSEAPPEVRISRRTKREPPRSMTTTTTTKTSMSEEIPSSSNSSTLGYGGGSGMVLPENCVAVLTYTPEPQEEFRRSMVAMVEGRVREKETEVDWDFVEELLFCYLELNEKKSHKYILSAFVDLIIVLRRNEKSISSRSGLIRSLSTRLARDRDRLRRRMNKL